MIELGVVLLWWRDGGICEFRVVVLERCLLCEKGVCDDMGKLLSKFPDELCSRLLLRPAGG